MSGLLGRSSEDAAKVGARAFIRHRIIESLRRRHRKREEGDGHGGEGTPAQATTSTNPSYTDFYSSQLAEYLWGSGSWKKTQETAAADSPGEVSPATIEEALEVVASAGLGFPRAAQIVAAIGAEEAVTAHANAGRALPLAVQAAKAVALSAGLQIHEACQITALVSVKKLVRRALEAGEGAAGAARVAVQAARYSGLASDAAGLTAALLVAKEVAGWMAEAGQSGSSPALIGSASGEAALLCWRTCESYSANEVRLKGKRK